MLIGPIFTREATTAPRRLSFYVTRTLFVAALFGLMLTSWQVLVGSQQVNSPGDLARFGSAVFQVLAPLQLAVALPFSALLTAAAVAQEKDRRTLILLLMTNLNNAELVLGKLLASMLIVFVVLAAAFPLFMISAALGGVSYGQIFRVFAVTVASALVAGSLGSTIALWREKTFQTLAMTCLAIVLWLVACELAARPGDLGMDNSPFAPVLRDAALTLSPWRAVQAAARPHFVLAVADGSAVTRQVGSFLAAACCGAAFLNTIAITMVRRWNPSREARPQTANELQPPESPVAQTSSVQVLSNVPGPQNVHSAGGKVRPVWDNPILWREIRTWAYGKKIIIVHLTYWAIFAVCATALVQVGANPSLAETDSSIIPTAALPLVPLLVVSLILLNALAVTSLTNERDGKALDLLLATDLSPKEIIFGKLGGAFYNAKEMVLLPLALCTYLWFIGQLSTENLVFLAIGLLTMFVFSAVLGLHCGMTFANSRTSIATSIGTLLFLFLGVSTCMRIMLAFSASFENQLQTFLGVVIGGGVALFATLGARNRSAAMAYAFIPAPFLTFFAMTSFLMRDFGTVLLVTVITYAFATAAMLVPAIAEFDVATGRTVERGD